MLSDTHVHLCCTRAYAPLHTVPCHHACTCVQVALSVATHAEELPDLTSSVRYSVVTNPTKESLTGAWKEWMQEASECLGVGNPAAGRAAK